MTRWVEAISSRLRLGRRGTDRPTEQATDSHSRHGDELTHIATGTIGNRTQSSAALAPTQRLGKYRVGARLGKGGFGSVYSGFDEVFERSVALKLYHPQQDRGIASVDGFLREARALRRVNHPNVVRVLDATFVDGVPLIVMELLEGQSLSGLLKKSHPVPLPAVTNIVRQIAEGLSHLHSLGLAHADLKPANVMVSEDASRAILVDLGLSHNLDRRGRTRVCGTPGYMAPEIWDGQRPSYESDVYALGCLCYELIAGCLPFAGTAEESRLGHLSATPARISSIRADTPSAVDDAVGEALAKDASMRPRDARVFAARLRKAFESSLLDGGILVAKQVANPVYAVAEGVPKGVDVYFCAICRGYFTLFIVRRDDVPVGFNVVAPSEQFVADPITGDRPVFCPFCQTPHGQYGHIQSVATSWEERRESN